MDELTKTINHLEIETSDVDSVRRSLVNVRPDFQLKRRNPQKSVCAFLQGNSTLGRRCKKIDRPIRKLLADRLKPVKVVT